MVIYTSLIIQYRWRFYWKKTQITLLIQPNILYGNSCIQFYLPESKFCDIHLSRDISFWIISKEILWQWAHCTNFLDRDTVCMTDWKKIKDDTLNSTTSKTTIGHGLTIHCWWHSESLKAPKLPLGHRSASRHSIDLTTEKLRWQDKQWNSLYISHFFYF